ncbi:MAG: protein-disulfide reductase DsbD family protein [Magnetospirillum sp.]|nr:protein-disulfide reductase DsbD family protein [Magnetospirillum sp.]
MVKTVLALAALLAASLGTAWAAEPGASDWATTETGKVRLVAATTAVGDGAGLKMGLHFRLEPGWKIYWRTPGDAGYPPKVDWSGSGNIGTPVLSWPAPKRFQLAGLQNHGYGGEVVLPLDVPVTRPGQAVTVAGGSITWPAPRSACPCRPACAWTCPPGRPSPRPSFTTSAVSPPWCRATAPATAWRWRRWRRWATATMPACA